MLTNGSGADVCGIAGISFAPDSAVDRTLVAQALLAGIAERGAHAVGYAVATAAGVHVEKRRTGASGLIEELEVPWDARHVLLHVRDFTKGHPSIEANNHPIRHGSVVGVHNGVIDNDDAVFRRRGWRRHEPEMTVDSEVIFASVEHRCDEVVPALEELRGTMAAAWLDEREPDALHVARGARRPLWLGVGRRELLFASTREALLLASRYARVELELEEVAEGTLLRVADGRIGERTGFRPDHRASRSPVVPMRSRQEQVACLARLQAIAAVA